MANKEKESEWEEFQRILQEKNEEEIKRQKEKEDKEKSNG